MSRQRFVILLLFVLALMAIWAVPAAAQTDEPGKLVMGGQYVLRSGQRLDGDLGVLGGQATIEQGATVNGDVLLAGGSLRVAGRIDGDLAVFGGAVTLEPTAYVGGDLVAFGGTVERSPGAVVAGDVREGDTLDIPGWRGALLFPGLERFEPGPQVTWQQSPGQWLLMMLWRGLRAAMLIAALAALALVIALLWPKGVERMGQAVIRQPLLALIVGLLSWVVGLGLFVLLVVTICLIPLALLLAAVFLVAALLSWAVAGWVVGRQLLALFKLRSTTVVAEAAFGTLLLATVYFLVSIIPCMDFVAGILIASFGLGAVVLTRFGTQPYPSAEAGGEAGVEVSQALALPGEEISTPPQLPGQ